MSDEDTPALRASRPQSSRSSKTPRTRRRRQTSEHGKAIPHQHGSPRVVHADDFLFPSSAQFVANTTATAWGEKSQRSPSGHPDDTLRESRDHSATRQDYVPENSATTAASNDRVKSEAAPRPSTASSRRTRELPARPSTAPQRRTRPVRPPSSATKTKHAANTTTVQSDNDVERLNGLLANYSIGPQDATTTPSTTASSSSAAATTGRDSQIPQRGSPSWSTRFRQQVQSVHASPTANAAGSRLADRIRKVCRLHKERQKQAASSCDDDPVSLSVVGASTANTPRNSSAVGTSPMDIVRQLQTVSQRPEHVAFVKAAVRGDLAFVEHALRTTPARTLQRERLVNCIVNLHGGMATTPLKSATRHGHASVVRLLLEANAQPDKTVGGGFNSANAGWTRALHDASTSEIAQLLVDHGAVKWSADPREPELLRHHRRNGNTAVLAVLQQDAGDRHMQQLRRAASAHRLSARGGRASDKIKKNLPMSVKESIAALEVYVVRSPVRAATASQEASQGPSATENEFRVFNAQEPPSHESAVQCPICLNVLGAPAPLASPVKKVVGAKKKRTFTELVMAKSKVLRGAGDNPLVRIGCGHFFHAPCIIACWKWSCLCPYCRHDCRLHLQKLQAYEKLQQEQGRGLKPSSRIGSSSRKQAVKVRQRCMVHCACMQCPCLTDSCGLLVSQGDRRRRKTRTPAYMKRTHSSRAMAAATAKSLGQQARKLLQKTKAQLRTKSEGTK